MELRSKEPYWLLKNGIVKSYPSLRKNILCDILIVGSGITGALMAYQLSSEGYKTVVIDKRDVGTGSTCATTSMIQYELDEPLYNLMKLAGKECAMDIYREAVNAIQKTERIVNALPADCGFAAKQSLHFAHDAQGAENLTREFECRKMAGIKVKWLSKENVYSTYGLVSEGGILSENAASMDAYHFTHSLLEYSANKFGLEVYDHTQLKSVEYGRTKNFAIVDTTAVIECGKIIYTTGYETHELIQSDIGKLISTYACVSEPLANLPSPLCETIFWNTQDPYFYFRTTSDNRILIGGEDEEFKNPDRRDALIEKKERDLVVRFREQMPDAQFIADFSWAGTFGATRDSLPYIGSHTDFKNSYFLLGFGGNGITFSVMGMEILSDALGGRQNKFLEYFKFKR